MAALIRSARSIELAARSRKTTVPLRMRTSVQLHRGEGFGDEAAVARRPRLRRPWLQRPIGASVEESDELDARLDEDDGVDLEPAAQQRAQRNLHERRAQPHHVRLRRAVDIGQADALDRQCRRRQQADRQVAVDCQVAPRDGGHLGRHVVLVAVPVDQAGRRQQPTDQHDDQDKQADQELPQRLKSPTIRGVEGTTATA